MKIHKKDIYTDTYMNDLLINCNSTDYQALNIIIKVTVNKWPFPSIQKQKNNLSKLQSTIYDSCRKNAFHITICWQLLDKSLIKKMPCNFKCNVTSSMHTSAVHLSHKFCFDIHIKKNGMPYRDQYSFLNRGKALVFNAFKRIYETTYEHLSRCTVGHHVHHPQSHDDTVNFHLR